MVNSIKQQFPIFQKNPDLVYLDSASTTQKPEVVIDSIINHYANSNANVHRGLYNLAYSADRAWQEAHETVAKYINAKSYKEIVFTRNSTESLNLLANSLALKEGDIILTTKLEHHSNLLPWLAIQEKRGVKVEFIDLLDSGEMDYDSFMDMVKKEGRNIKLLTLSHMSNVLGILNPVEKYIKVAKQIGVLTIVDAAQSIAHTSIDVQKLGCDFLVFSSHKVYGPSGVGVLYGREVLLNDLPPFLKGGEMVKNVKLSSVEWNELPWKFEAGTPAIEAGVAMAAALNWLDQEIKSVGGWEQYSRNEEALTKKALDMLSKVEGIEIVGGGDKHGVISLNIKGTHPHDIASILSDSSVCVRAGYHCAQPLHEALGLPGSVRLSLGIYNDEGDIKKFIQAVEKVAKLFR
ncbi:MAG TPA: cysteine desulfurase [Candidatus Dojkabacteria bacterium]|nr:cysteine desulfurase [Candidatus Dojkabacteria bacterium]